METENSDIRCCATLLSGKQCSHKHLAGQTLCGTHLKLSVKNTVSRDSVISGTTEIIIYNVNGISYFVDINCNIYNVEDVLSNTINPSIIGKLEKGNPDKVIIFTQSQPILQKMEER